MDPLLPISLTAIKGNWRAFQARKPLLNFKALKKKILDRDNHTCRFCGFYDKQYQEVINIDHHYKNNHPNNLATACAFCAQCFFIDSVGLAPQTGGTVIYLPEISQGDLNHLMRTLFCTSDRDTAYRGKLKSVILSFNDRAQAVTHCFGPNSDQPNIFGQSLLDAHLPQNAYQHPLIKHLRLLPNKKAFNEQIDYWKQTVFAKVPI